MRMKRNRLSSTLLPLLLILSLAFAACAPADDGGMEAGETMEESEAAAAAEIPDADLAMNPDTVGSDRLLILPGRGRFGVGVWGSITASNWNFGSETYYQTVMPLIFLGPLGNSTPTPWLAKRVDPVDDRTALEIELYPEAKWSDGETITTEDVSFTLHLLYHADADYWLGDARGMIPNVAGGQDYYDGKTESIEGIQIIDDFNMRVEFNTPVGQIWRDLGMLGILPEHHLGGFTAAQLWAGDFPDAWMPEVFSGPYQVVKYDEEAKYLENQRWEEWWGNAIYGKPGIMRYAEQSGLRLENFLEGQSDVIKIGAADYDSVKDLDDVSIHPRTFMMTGYGLNRMEDRKLSRTVMDAIAYAIDRELWAEVLYFGFGDPEDSVFGLRGHLAGAADSFCPDCDESLVLPRQYNPEMSMQLLAEAEDAGEWESDRVLSILTGAGGDAPVLLQQQLAAVGIESEILQGEELRQERRADGNYDIDMVGGWVMNTIRNCTYWVGSCEEDYWPSIFHWCNEEFRSKCVEAMGTTDPNEFTRLSEEIMNIYFNDGPIWGVTQIAEFYVTTAALGGFIPEEAFNFLGTCGEKGVSSWYWLE